MVLCSYVTNVMLSPSPLAPPATYAVWSRDTPRHDSLRAALDGRAGGRLTSARRTSCSRTSRTACTCTTGRTRSCPRCGATTTAIGCPSPTTIDYVALDKTQIGENNRPLYEAMFAVGGPFTPVLEDENVIVGKRVGTDPAVDVQPQRGSCRSGGGPTRWMRRLTGTTTES